MQSQIEQIEQQEQQQQLEELDHMEDNMDDYMFDMYSSASSEIDGYKLPAFSTGFVKWNHKFPKHLWDFYKCKQVTVGVYETPIHPLSLIRKATTGKFTTARVGTRDEDHFFVVNWATGHRGRQTPMKLYFDSPAEFEKHCFVQISEKNKARWQKKSK